MKLEEKQVKNKMQTLKNKSHPLKIWIRSSLFMDIILAIVIIGFFVQKEPVYAATYSEGSGVILELKSNFHTIEDLVFQTPQPIDSKPTATLLQNIIVPNGGTLEATLNLGVGMAESPASSKPTIPVTPTAARVLSFTTATNTSAPLNSLPTETSVLPTPNPTEAAIPSVSKPDEMSGLLTLTPTKTSLTPDPTIVGGVIFTNITLPPTATITPVPTQGQNGGLTPSGEIFITADNQVVQNVSITSLNGDGIRCYNYSGIKIHNVTISYSGGQGISLQGCDGATISNVNIIHVGAPSSGPNDSTMRNCISVIQSNNLVASNILATDCSSGAYVQQSNATSISFIKCVNMRGPFPRGQCVQFNQSSNFSLSDFYSYNDISIAWTTDNINVYNSPGGTIQRGVIDGNNSVNGSGVVVEGSSNVSVSDVDVYHWCNCAFGTNNGTNVSFTRIHAGESYKPCTQGGPASGTGVVFISYNFNPSPPTEGTIFSQAQYFNIASDNQILYDENPSTVAVKDITESEFTKLTPIIPVVPPIH